LKKNIMSFLTILFFYILTVLAFADLIFSDP